LWEKNPIVDFDENLEYMHRDQGRNHVWKFLLTRFWRDVVNWSWVIVGQQVMMCHIQHTLNLLPRKSRLAGSVIMMRTLAQRHEYIVMINSHNATRREDKRQWVWDHWVTVVVCTKRLLVPTGPWLNRRTRQRPNDCEYLSVVRHELNDSCMRAIVKAPSSTIHCLPQRTLTIDESPAWLVTNNAKTTPLNLLYNQPRSWKLTTLKWESWLVVILGEEEKFAAHPDWYVRYVKMLINLQAHYATNLAHCVVFAMIIKISRKTSKWLEWI